MSGYKTAKRSRRDDDSDSEAEVAKPTKATKKVKTGKSASEAEGGVDKDAEGNSFWLVSWQSIRDMFWSGVFSRDAKLT